MSCNNNLNPRNCGRFQVMGNCDGCKLLDLVDLIDDEESRYCNNCGADFDELVYERTVANGDIYHCSICKDEHIFPEQSAID